MAYLSKLSRRGYLVLLGMLLLQALLLGLTLTDSAKGLAWATRDYDVCGDDSVTEYFWLEACITQSGKRYCFAYKSDGCDRNDQWCEPAKTRFPTAGGFAACNLVLTGCLAIFATLFLCMGASVGTCSGNSAVFNKAYMVITVTQLALAGVAAGVAGDAAVITGEVANCEQGGQIAYGVGVHLFLLVWMSFQLLLATCPCGALADTTPPPADFKEVEVQVADPPQAWSQPYLP